MTERLKVLVGAYACSPFKGSEPGVGWGFVEAMSRYHDLWVITEEEKFRGDVERFLAERPDIRGSVQFFFVRKQRSRWLRRLWPPSYYWYYRAWHRSALDVARRLHAEVGFDLVHQLTMVGFREPGYLWTLGVPFVWGPIGGMGLLPWRFLTRLGWYGGAYYAAYNIVNYAQTRWSRRPRLAAQRAGRGLITATSENSDGARRHWRCASETIAEVGLPCDPVGVATARAVGAPLTIVWSGEHKPGKALNLGLDALARVPKEVEWTLEVLGDGREKERWLRRATSLGIGGRCRFRGWLDRAHALSIMRSAHVMLITSLRDLTSTVTVEALALGLPIVCPDHCGFADAVDETCGIKVPVGGPADFIRGIASAITKLAEDEPGRLALGNGALRRAREFTWAHKASRCDAVYRSVLNEPESRVGQQRSRGWGR